MIYADFESMLVPEDNGKKTPKKCYTKKYQIHIACSNGYKLDCVDDKFSQPNAQLNKDAVYNFFNNLIEENKLLYKVMKKLFNKELVMTKENNEDFKNSTFVIKLDNVEALREEIVISILY